MKLFLSSLNLGQLPDKLIPEFKKLLTCERSGKEKPFLITIHNATDHKGPEKLAERDKEDSVLADFGIEHKRIDLRDYDGNKEELASEIKRADAVFMGGGNTFYLNYWLHKVGADKILKSEAEKGLVLGGGSAGAIAMSPSLQHYEYADDPSIAPEVIWEGLGLVSFEPLVHADSEKYKEIINKIRKKLFREDGVEYKEINDDQAIAIDGNQARLVP